jgi:hypothetical protein
MKKYLLLPSIVIAGLPMVTMAAQAPTDFASFVSLINGIINILIPLIFTLTFIVLMWGVIKSWILNGGDASEIEKGKKIVVVGIIALVVMSGIWGIIALLRYTFFGA